MYLAIITLPLLGSVVSGFFGRKVGVNGAQLITSLCVIVTTLLAIVAFFEVGLNNIPVYLNLFRWIDSESLNVLWGFHFDSLTVAMLLPVLIVSSLVHIYSIGYMSHDPWCRVRGRRDYGDKLSNSGEPLKPMVPSCSWKTMSGWSNYSEMVTSHRRTLRSALVQRQSRAGLKPGENEMGNRGYKSAKTKSKVLFSKWIILKSMAVKEQRVYGSWSIKQLMGLRCILKGSERNRGIYQSFNIFGCWSSIVIKIPSKQYRLGQWNKPAPLLSMGPPLGRKWRVGNMNYSTSTQINPWVWSGLIDGEGSFSIILVKNKTRKLGWGVEPKFKLGLHRKDYNVLSQLQLFLGGAGAIYLARKREFVNYSISSIKDLNKLIVHLEKYPLFTQKAGDFFLFKQIINLMNNKAHLTVEGLNQIVNLKASMNWGLSEKLISEFPGYRAVERSVINCDPRRSGLIINPSWLSGFISAEGNFDVRTTQSNSLIGYRVQLRFIITQHIRDLGLMVKIVQYLGSGKIYKYSKSAVHLSIVDFSVITNRIIPLIKENPLLGIKSVDYLDWCKIHELMLNRSHLTVKGMNIIREIKLGMNRGRKFEVK